MKLKELRQSKGMTRTELSKIMNIPVRTIARWENGETDMYLKSAIQLSKFFKVSLDEFVQ